MVAADRRYRPSRAHAVPTLVRHRSAHIWAARTGAGASATRGSRGPTATSAQAACALETGPCAHTHCPRLHCLGSLPIISVTLPSSPICARPLLSARCTHTSAASSPGGMLRSERRMRQYCMWDDSACVADPPLLPGEVGTCAIVNGRGFAAGLGECIVVKVRPAPPRADRPPSLRGASLRRLAAFICSCCRAAEVMARPVGRRRGSTVGADSSASRAIATRTSSASPPPSMERQRQVTKPGAYPCAGGCQSIACRVCFRNCGRRVHTRGQGDRAAQKGQS